MLLIGLYTGSERRSILAFLVILSTLIRFWRHLGPLLRKAVIWCQGTAAEPVKAFSKDARILNDIDSRVLSLTKARSVIARKREAVADMAGHLEVSEKMLLCNLISYRAISGAWWRTHLKKLNCAQLRSPR
jgi:hypothetical protein